MSSPKKPILQTDQKLALSSVVANNRMNRERVLSGVNSYQKELGLDFVANLMTQAPYENELRWMDLCCGQGNAMIQAAAELADKPEAVKMHLEGLDLVGMFSEVSPQLSAMLHLQVGAVLDWRPEAKYDLITCVHGLHYIGDKLRLLHQAISYLKPLGLLVVNLDPTNLKDADGNPLTDWWRALCKQQQWSYNPHRHLLIATRKDWPVNWTYLGADDEAGPNYSGQPVVDSYYAFDQP